MRNLQVFREEWVKLKLDDDRKEERMVAATYDSERIRMFFASDACCVYGINLLSEQDRWTISLLDPLGTGAPGTVKEEDRVIFMEFLLEKEALALALATGDILQLTPANQEVEVVGAVAGGIVSMALSPDGELLVVATGAGQLLLMTQDWDVFYEISLNQTPASSTSGLIPPGGVQISWRGDGKYFATLASCGNAESEGKNETARSLKVWERETGALHSCGEPTALLQPAVGWSCNGSRIATAFSRADAGKPPVALFYERNGLKRDTFEILGPPSARVELLQWNSNSELLAVLLRCEQWDAIQVWNCNNFHWYLKQEWRFQPEEEVNLFWDPEKPLCIMFWTVFGYLRRITLCWKSSVIEGNTSFVIDGNSVLVTPLCLSIIPPPMFSFKVNFSAPVHTLATLFENTSRCLIAAGLSDGSLSVIILPEVSTWADLEGAELSALSAKSDPVVDFRKIRHISWLGSKTLVGSLFHKDLKIEKGHKAGKSVSPTEAELTRMDDSVVEFKLYLNEGISELARSKNAAFSEQWVLKLVSQTTVDQPIVAVFANPLNSSLEESEIRKAEAYVQLADGSVALYTSGDDVGRYRYTGSNISLNVVKFQSPSPWMRAVTRGRHEQDEAVLIGLDESGMLHVNNQLVSTDCTSFTVHESIQGKSQLKVTHLVFTTRLDTLHVINLEEILSGGLSGEELNIASTKVPGNLDAKPPRIRKVKGDNTAENSLKIRPMWERGARLVTTIGGMDVAVIVQTIRGNLETIYPRGLVLGAIASALTEDNFQDAMLLARRNHINLNVIVDYKGWEEFSAKADLFVKQVSSLSHITELIGALTKDNVIESTYRNLIPLYKTSSGKGGSRSETPIGGDITSKKTEVHSSTPTNKVRGVLGAIRSALQKEVVDSPARELCILTTHASSDPPELEAALERVKTMREAEIKGISEGNISHLNDVLSAEAAVKHLIWLTDADSVFNVALGLYDLHLAAIVASHAQRDPKEFLPLLEELGQMQKLQMRYTIDCRLGRYESALRNCVDMGEDLFEDSLKLVTAHPTLFPTALHLFQDEGKKNHLLNAWGDHLVEKKKFDDAAAAFCACSRFDRALDAYRLGGQWECVMIMAGRLGKTSTELKELAVELRDELEAMGRPKEAAKIALDYCGDVEGAMMLLIDAHEWAEVARLAYLHGQKQLIDVQLQSAVLDCATAHLRELDESVEKIGKYLARFLSIHQRRLLLSNKLRTEGEGQEAVDFDASSDISIASSIASGLSGLSAYTRGSSRVNTGSTTTSKGGRRAHKSKGGKIRAGSPGEEMALVQHMKGTALSAVKVEEQRLLLQALLQLGFERIARQLQRALTHFITVQEDAVRQAEEKLKEEQSQESSVPQEVDSVESSPNVTIGTKDVQWKWVVLIEQ
ncbi:hypothetical protein Mapa_003963 [Marchantia paleacea]|nr:hypothetical protein Mapa_003963 [Marchantia paleacea]